MAPVGSGGGRPAAFQRRWQCGQAVGILLAALAAASTASTVSGAVTKTAYQAASEAAATASSGLADSVPTAPIGGGSLRPSRQQEQLNASTHVLERLRRVYCRHLPAGRGCAESSELQQAAMRHSYYYYYYYRAVKTAQPVNSYGPYASPSPAPVTQAPSQVPVRQPQAAPVPSTQPQASPVPSAQPQPQATLAPVVQPQATPTPALQPHVTPALQPHVTPAPTTYLQMTPEPPTQPHAQPMPTSAPSTQPQAEPTPPPAASPTSQAANSSATTPDTYPPSGANDSHGSGSDSNYDSYGSGGGYDNNNDDQQYRSLVAPTPQPSVPTASPKPSAPTTWPNRSRPTASPPPKGPVAEVVATSEVCLVQAEWKNYVKANEEALTEYNMPSSKRDSFIKSIKRLPTKVGDYHCFRDQVQFDEMGQLVAAAFSTVSAAQMTERLAGEVPLQSTGGGHITTSSHGGWSPETAPDGRRHNSGGGTASRSVHRQGSCDERAASCDAGSWRYGCTSRRNCCCPSFCVGYFDLAFRYLRIAQSTRRRSTSSCCVSSFC